VVIARDVGHLQSEEKWPGYSEILISFSLIARLIRLDLLTAIGFPACGSVQYTITQKTNTTQRKMNKTKHTTQ
jgi:hypothetical protein